MYKIFQKKQIPIKLKSSLINEISLSPSFRVLAFIINLKVVFGKGRKFTLAEVWELT